MTGAKDALDKARDAARAGDYAAAAQAYEYFFDHALELDRSYYGVRLSYCLEEWSDVGDQYPPARERLRQKSAAALALAKQSRDPEKFHDYHAICRALKCPGEAVAAFLDIHTADPDFAASIFRFIRRDLVAAKEWEICGSYLQQPDKQYRHFLEAFDGALKHGRDSRQDEAIRFAKDWFAENMADLLLVLKYTGRNEEADIIQEQMSLDLMSRGMPELADDVADKINLSA